MKKKLKKIFSKKGIIIIIIILVLVFVGYKIITRNGGPEYIIDEVSYGTVVKEVSETGMVKVSERANLGFKNSGKISAVYVSVGDIVTSGQSLAKLDTNQLYIQLSESQASLDVANADYAGLLAGSSVEEITIAETNVANAQTTLEDVKIDATEDLNQANEDAADQLGDAYLDVHNALIAVESLRSKYYGGSDQESLAINNSITTIAAVRDRVSISLEVAKESLNEVKIALADVRSTIESDAYRVVSGADKTIIDNQRTYINTAYGEIVGAQQNISTVKITNSTNINTAEANLASAKNTLALKKAGPTTESINIYLAKIKQAEAQVSLLNNQLTEATLRSPADGQITSVDKKRGETVSSADTVVGFLTSGPFQIEVDIYEEDIVEVQVNNYVRVELPAFPDIVFDGRVITIDPAEKLVDGVVYYEVNISFEVGDQNIKPGMTADVIIEINKKENVLTVPIEAVEKQDGVKKVKTYLNKELVYKEVEFGLEGEDLIEIISGLSEGDQVIVGEKQK